MSVKFKVTAPIGIEPPKACKTITSASKTEIPVSSFAEKCFLVVIVPPSSSLLDTRRKKFFALPLFWSNRYKRIRHSLVIYYYNAFFVFWQENESKNFNIPFFLLEFTAFFVFFV
jgi:hypothetical protein